tara:strand:- start:30 stop:377 length:348 start_codon:yes stop_codon:yes gene_type:complete
MSTLEVSNINDGTTTVATTYVTNGSARAWCQYSGSGSTFADSFGMSSATDNGTGDYTVTLSNNMANDDYAPSNISLYNNVSAHTIAAASVRVQLTNNAFSSVDGLVCVTFHGDLA